MHGIVYSIHWVKIWYKTFFTIFTSIQSALMKWKQYIKFVSYNFSFNESSKQTNWFDNNSTHITFQAFYQNMATIMILIDGTIIRVWCIVFSMDVIVSNASASQRAKAWVCANKPLEKNSNYIIFIESLGKIKIEESLHNMYAQ